MEFRHPARHCRLEANGVVGLGSPKAGGTPSAADAQGDELRGPVGVADEVDDRPSAAGRRGAMKDDGAGVPGADYVIAAAEKDVDIFRRSLRF